MSPQTRASQERRLEIPAGSPLPLAAAPLPRGRHGIPPELVAANQRERLLCAATEIFAEQGYASLAIRNVIQRARVSRATFYEIFDDKLDCVLAAQQRAYDGLHQALAAACASQQDWPNAVAAAVGAALDFAVGFPTDARLLVASSLALSEPQLAREGVDLHGLLVGLLREGAQRYPGARSPAAVADRAAVGAAISLVANCFACDEIDALPLLRADLAQIILTPYLGGNEAKRIAQSASAAATMPSA